jgi:hypothetical protein
VIGDLPHIISIETGTDESLIPEQSSAVAKSILFEALSNKVFFTDLLLSKPKRLMTMPWFSFETLAGS